MVDFFFLGAFDAGRADDPLLEAAGFPGVVGSEASSAVAFANSAAAPEGSINDGSAMAEVARSGVSAGSTSGARGSGPNDGSASAAISDSVDGLKAGGATELSASDAEGSAYEPIARFVLVTMVRVGTNSRPLGPVR